MSILDEESEAASGEKDRRIVTALARGLDILRCFKPGDPALTNQEIAARTRLPKPTVSRLTHTLLELGYLTYSRRAGTYQLGPGVLALGYATIAGLEIRERARPMMEELATQAEATVALGAQDRLSVVYLDVCRGEQTIALSRNVGSRLPLATTSMGRAIIATLPDAERDYLLRAIREREPENFKELERGILQAMDDLAKYGFCTSFGSWIKDVNAAGAPIVSLDGEHLYAINIGGPSFLVSRDTIMEELGPKIAEIAKSLSAPIEALRAGHRD